jgi:hypothetical protein
MKSGGEMRKLFGNSIKSALLILLISGTSGLSADNLDDTGDSQMRHKAQTIKLTADAEVALLALEKEKTIFASEFNWGKRNEYVARQEVFQQQHQDYIVRGYEIMKEMYLELNHGDLAAFEQKKIDKIEDSSAQVILAADETGSAVPVNKMQSVEVNK